jgi:hypothetical protein
MAESLDKVLQPDGTYKWELVELRAANLYEKDKPKEVKPASQPRPKRRSKAEQEIPQTAEYEF